MVSGGQNGSSGYENLIGQFASESPELQLVEHNMISDIFVSCTSTFIDSVLKTSSKLM